MRRTSWAAAPVESRPGAMMLTPMSQFNCFRVRPPGWKFSAVALQNVATFRRSCIGSYRTHLSKSDHRPVGRCADSLVSALPACLSRRVRHTNPVDNTFRRFALALVPGVGMSGVQQRDAGHPKGTMLRLHEVAALRCNMGVSM